jgi:hypothetical protein
MVFMRQLMWGKLVIYCVRAMVAALNTNQSFQLQKLDLTCLLRLAKALAVLSLTPTLNLLTIKRAPSKTDLKVSKSF